jgi:hypothetical protein
VIYLGVNDALTVAGDGDHCNRTMWTSQHTHEAAAEYAGTFGWSVGDGGVLCDRCSKSLADKTIAAIEAVPNA